MRRLAWASVRGHPVRTLATALSVVFGVAFVSGTFALTDTVRTAFDQLFGSPVAGFDLVVRSVAPGEGDAAFAQQPGIRPDLADNIGAVPGVDEAEPRYVGFARVARDDGTTVGGLGALTQGIDAPNSEQVADTRLRSGRYPQAESEVAIDEATAAELGQQLGGTVSVVLNGPPREFTLVGLIAPPTAVTDLAGSTTVVFEDSLAQELYGSSGATYITVRVADGVAVEEVQEQLTSMLGDGHAVLTVGELVQDSIQQIGQFLGFLTRGLLAFAGAALLVGGVIIFNTFSITIVQRTRELALLQTVGADGGQIVNAILLEALLTGVAGSAVGLGAGIAVARGLHGLLSATGLPLPNAELVLAPRTVAVSFGVGVIVTLLSAFGPALRAARLTPVDAMRRLEEDDRRASQWRLIIGSLAAGLATSVLIGVASGVGGLLGLGVGAAMVILAVFLLSPLIVGPLTVLLGFPVKLISGFPGLMARANAVRNPQRTAATAAAPIIGLAMVCFALILVASFRSSLEAVLDERFRADFEIQATDQLGYPGELTAAAREVSGVQTVSTAKVGRVALNGEPRTMFAIDPATFTQGYDIEIPSGDIGLLDQGGIAVSNRLGLPVGSTVELTLSLNQQPEPMRIVAWIEDLHLPGTTRVGQILMATSQYNEVVPGQPDLVSFIRVSEGVDPATVGAELDPIVTQYPGARLADLAELRAQVDRQTSRLLGLVVALLLLSVIVALVGVVNILSLSVLERSRELGLLQALGMTAGQARGMVRWEYLIVAFLGAVLGVAFGTLFGWLGVQVLESEGLRVFELPAGHVAAAVGAMLTAGLIASVIPARRASHVDVLQAVTVE